ncbi:MAG: PhzF family phenazine biosynthesis protein [Alteraurantiacibacter sp.]
MQLDLVDVFGSVALSGNPLAVVRGGAGLSKAQMLRLTQWLGFSETTFLLPPTDPDADYQVRIFYPAGELPFAGHPTLGSAFAWLAAGGVPRTAGSVVQECGVGLVEVRQQTADTLAFRAPALTRSGPLGNAERDEAARVAGVQPDWIVEAVHIANGPKWQLLRLHTAEQVLMANPAHSAPIGTDVGLAAPAAPGSGADWEVRAFFANQHGALCEDPVTGSFNAGLAMHLFASGLATGSTIAAQGRRTGADGRVTLTQDNGGSVWVAGRCDMVAAGGQLPSALPG